MLTAEEEKYLRDQKAIAAKKAEIKAIRVDANTAMAAKQAEVEALRVQKLKDIAVKTAEILAIDPNAEV